MSSPAASCLFELPPCAKLFGELATGIFYTLLDGYLLFAKEETEADGGKSNKSQRSPN